MRRSFSIVPLKAWMSSPTMLYGVGVRSFGVTPLQPAGSSGTTDAKSSGVPDPNTVGSTVALRSSEEIALEESQNQQRQVDPFRIGYNMGMQNVHLETLRNKLDDNLELLKSHFHSIREGLRTNHDALRAMQTEYNIQTRAQFDAGLEGVRERVDQLSTRVHANEELMREFHKQQFESLQKHVDDRLENIKDTVKLSVAILFALNLWILFLVNQSLAGPNRHTATAAAVSSHQPQQVHPNHQQHAHQNKPAAAPTATDEKKKGWF